jgi:hypothetical protein
VSSDQRERAKAFTLVTWFETMLPGSLQGLVLGSTDRSD